MARIGELHESAGDLELAIESYKKAVELNPEFAFYYVCLGKVYEKKDERELAKENYLKAYSIGEDFGDDFRGWLRQKLIEP